MTTIAEMLSDRNREQLLARLDELQAIDRENRQPSANRPPRPATHADRHQQAPERPVRSVR